ncbi:MAG: type II toxin-antitoxin system Phd/YefM family antitoxin [Acidobacteria bacterium]|nr:type II toxin-antitoxin system Phd/YefM family antitoxin [Acidobacteriota bacterium]
MPKRYSIAQARDRLAQLVHGAEGGAAIELTRRGEPVAVLVSIKDYQRFLAGGRTFREALDKFRNEVNVADLGIEPALFPRDPSAGRDVAL